MTTAERLRAEGRAEGRAEERANTLVELLTLKFGPVSTAVVDTVRAADPAEVRVWIGRVLAAASVEDVFA